eukprot:gene9470-11141_t
MSFFDSVKKSLGMSKEKVNDNGLGRPGFNYDQFELTFVEEKLGIGISKYTGDMPHLGALSNSKEERSCPVVTNCEARSFDVKPGDLIVALEGNPIIVLSEEEKALRRERLSAAAQDRSKSWDKKLGQKKSSQSLNVPIVDGNAVEAEAAAAGTNGTHADTERAIRKTKELEVRIEQQMGYNPFRPHMSFASPSSGAAAATTNANYTTTIASTGAGGNGSDAIVANVAGLDLDAAALAEETTMAEVDDAFAMLLSLGESEQERGKVAVSTVSRMIQNLAAAPEDPKLRSIRVSNKAFQSKVAAVPGGAELLVAAGYAYRNCSTTNSTSTSTSGTSSGSTGAVDQENGEGEGELFLVHDMNVEGRGKLHYTLSRIQELLESVSGAASPVSPRPK